MKASILFLAAAALAAPLAAQDRNVGTDLIDLFEKSQREGATDEQLMRMLQDKALIDPEGLEFRELSPEEIEYEQNAVFDVIRRLKESEQRGDEQEPRADAPLRPEAGNSTPQIPRWFVGLVVSPVDPALGAHFDLPDGTGVSVESVMRGSPAAQAGIKVSDIIVTANGGRVSSLADLKTAVEKAGSEGRALKLDVIQRGKRVVLEVKPRSPEDLTGNPDRDNVTPAMRPMIEIERRLDRQQQEIEALRRELQQLRARLQRD